LLYLDEKRKRNHKLQKYLINLTKSIQEIFKKQPDLSYLVRIFKNKINLIIEIK